MSNQANQDRKPNMSGNMLGCILSLMISIVPRLIFLVLWLFTPRVDLAFDNWIIPLLGLIFLPFTILAYVIVWDPLTGMNFAAWLLVLGGLLLDVGSYAVSGLLNRSRHSDKGG